MNRHFDNEWEQELDRELKALPDVEAPATLIPRVMERVRAQEEKRRAWSLNAGSPARRLAVAAMVSLFAAIAVWVGWRMWEGHMTTPLFGEVQEWFAAATALGRAACVLLSALVTGLRSIHPVFLAMYGAFAAACYFACVGAGALAYRFITAQRQNSDS
ncbi:MAG TPA: hypothetical protein GYA07_10555 [Verrucomicrobia bacterium]|nr:hypothetical protein [Verrucomicrobiota bacterium]HOB33063.1 hypothetical protein [Verrucomicrobiota bacterium]HOP97830.1 hypothetical protein [Verrucomicrobiota bacterium]HPU57207.1 hypothetical protein [Verrucomicrobiota bacterium]